MAKKVAKLVHLSLITRVVVDEDASDEEIINSCYPNIQAKIDNNELGENVEDIRNDTECPAGSFKFDKLITSNDVQVGDVIKLNGDNFAKTYVKKQQEEIDRGEFGNFEEAFTEEEVLFGGMPKGIKEFDGASFKVLEIEPNGKINVEWLDFQPTRKGGSKINSLRFDAPMFYYFEMMK